MTEQRICQSSATITATKTPLTCTDYAVLCRFR